MYRYLFPFAAAAAVLGAGIAVLVKLRSGMEENEKSKAAADTVPPADESRRNFGSFSFLCGIENAVPVELGISYDPENYSFSIIDNGFPAFTNAAEVILIEGESVSLQIEGADIHGGISFDDAMQQLGQTYNGLVPVNYGNHSGYKYINGDSMCIALPIDGAPAGYVLVTLIKEHKCEVDFTELPDNADVIEMLSSLEFTV